MYSKFKGGKDEPTEEEVSKALKDFLEIPKIAPLVAIILTSPIPGSSVGYLALMASLKKISKNRIDLIPKRFGEIFEEEKKSEISSE